jgi:hypothetical protein
MRSIANKHAMLRIKQEQVKANYCFIPWIVLYIYKHAQQELGK